MQKISEMMISSRRGLVAPSCSIEFVSKGVSEICYKPCCSSILKMITVDISSILERSVGSDKKGTGKDCERGEESIC